VVGACIPGGPFGFSFPTGDTLSNLAAAVQSPGFFSADLAAAVPELAAGVAQ